MKKINKISEKIQKIKVIKNGPYFVSGNIKLQEQIITVDSNQVPFKWSKGVKYSNKELYALCRCGQSKNKPFFDSSHYSEVENVEAIHKQ